jgi:hypothetical protein
LLMMMVQSTLMSITPLKFARIGKVLISCQLTDDQFQAASRLSSQCYIKLHMKLKDLMHAWRATSFLPLEELPGFQAMLLGLCFFVIRNGYKSIPNSRLSLKLCSFNAEFCYWK